LCDLEFVGQPLLPSSLVLYQEAIGKDGDDECVVDLSPVEEVEALD